MRTGGENELIIVFILKWCGRAAWCHGILIYERIRRRISYCIVRHPFRLAVIILLKYAQINGVLHFVVLICLSYDLNARLLSLTTNGKIPPTFSSVNGPIFHHKTSLSCGVSCTCLIHSISSEPSFTGRQTINSFNWN